ncbi:MAG TPA: hypothetical protein VFG96_07750 [Jiangellaceae bacterium]|nr:hypothetical protein [Jiangellaceae bacterium]
MSTAEAEARAPRRLSWRGRAWRVGIALAGIAALVHGTLADSDDYFPFGSMAQYASAHDLDSQVRSVYMLADTDSGRERVPVALHATGTGIGRAEVEGQLGRILADPSLMQTIADAYRALHPDRDQYTTLYLMRDTYQLRDGYQAGPPATELLAEWDVR